eukprot:5343542-Prymnesium_polylepis.1
MRRCCSVAPHPVPAKRATRRMPTGAAGSARLHPPSRAPRERRRTTPEAARRPSRAAARPVRAPPSTDSRAASRRVGAPARQSHPTPSRGAQSPGPPSPLRSASADTKAAGACAGALAP